MFSKTFCSCFLGSIWGCGGMGTGALLGLGAGSGWGTGLRAGSFFLAGKKSSRVGGLEGLLYSKGLSLGS